MVNRGANFTVPQGLKPALLLAESGAAEAAPFQNLWPRAARLKPRPFKTSL